MADISFLELNSMPISIIGVAQCSICKILTVPVGFGECGGHNTTLKNNTSLQNPSPDTVFPL